MIRTVSASFAYQQVQQRYSTLWFCHQFSALKRPHTPYKKKVASYIYNFCNPLQENHALYLRNNHKNQDGIKTELKSKGDFDTAYDVAMCPLKKLIVFQPRDWPCQFYYGNYTMGKSYTNHLRSLSARILGDHTLLRNRNIF